MFYKFDLFFLLGVYTEVSYFVNWIADKSRVISSIAAVDSIDRFQIFH